ncbi:DMT family transporter [Paenibacillus sp. YPG26]|uniref:DMT family transporter n=1 Tax=Paenibacillus sp. YPG26 TaxID=2878915 RepID=UPI002041875F|nr:DMT family transporter [Paenibacillus sp. YPG26]USB32698.1 DMT family transporter [Paenibacillus sp. YPG26]
MNASSEYSLIKSRTPLTMETIGILLVAFGAAFWGLGGVLRTPLGTHLTSAQVVFVEHLLLCLYAIPVVWIGRRQLQTLNFKQWGAILFISWGASGAANIFFTAAFQYGHPSVVLLLQKLQPIIVLITARILLKEKLPRTFGIELLIALAGTYLLTFGFTTPFHDVTPEKVIGSLLSIGAAVLWGGGTVAGRYLLGKVSFETLAGSRFLFALPFMAMLVASEGSSWSHMFERAFTTSDILFFLIILVTGIVSMLLYYRGLSRTKASYATLAELSFPAIGVIVNWVFLDQLLSIGQWIGFIIIWFVVFRITRRSEAPDDNILKAA